MKDTIFAPTAQAHAQYQTDAPIIAVKLNETGFYPIYTQATAADLNDPDVTTDIVESAVSASIFGWNLPIAKAARDYLTSKQQAST